MKLKSHETMPKIAIYVSGGVIQGVRSNIGQELEIEIVDEDNEPETSEDRWIELYKELEFGNL